MRPEGKTRIKEREDKMKGGTSLIQVENPLERNFSPLYLAIISGILLVILLLNGFLEISRTKRGFYSLLEREAIVLLQHFEKNIQATLIQLQGMEEGVEKPFPNGSGSGVLLGLEESIGEYLIEVSHRIDQADGEKPLTPPDLQTLTQHYSITSIAFYDPNGKLLRSWPSPLSPGSSKPLLQELIGKKRSVVSDLFGKPLFGNQIFSLGLWRKKIPGIIILQLSSNQMRSLLRQFTIQRSISDIGLREGILFISVQDHQLLTLAHTDPSFVGRREDDPFLKNSLKTDHPLSRHRQLSNGEEIFEVVKAFHFSNQPWGLIRIGYSSKEVQPLLGEVKKNVALSVFIFLTLGVMAITLIWVNQNRHLKKIKEMENRIQLAERLSSLGHLAAGVAHEIRNPLNAIGMGIQRLKREFLPGEEKTKEEYIQFTELILKEIQRVNEIIEEFLTLSRPFQLNLKVSSLQDLLKNLMALFREEASAQGIQLQVDLNAQLPPVKIDEQRLTQALINIMKNGMEAMEKGGVLRLEAHSYKDRIEVVLSDTGSGIPVDHMGKIFNYYYTTKEKGVGLGLPIAHRIIEAHGGQLKIESQVGVGTKVTIVLPC